MPARGVKDLDESLKRKRRALYRVTTTRVETADTGAARARANRHAALVYKGGAPAKSGNALVK